VDNPLFGENGAAFIYAPQKGADPQTVKVLDEGLRNFDRVVRKLFHTSANFPGAGAGGGLPAGGKIFLAMTIMPGMRYISEAAHLDEKAQGSDLIITGEGKIDHQTLSGKVVMELARLGAKYKKPVAAACGVCELADDDIQKLGLFSVISLVNESTTPEMAMQHPVDLLNRRVASEFGSRFQRP
jgi:glycerate kinase